jgi:small-conductance mechanosensitive channel
MKLDRADLAAKRKGTKWLPKRLRDEINEGLDRIERLQEVNADLLEALKTIEEHTNPDSADNYRADDREGCLDAVYETAQAAIEKARGTI